MATQRKIRVMISSRNLDRIKYEGKDATLSDVRLAAERMLEGVKIFGAPVFEVWLNESAVENTTQSARETCIKRVGEADIVIVLYNGRSGWATHDGGIGICHEEFQNAILSGPQRTYVIALPQLASEPGETERDIAFATYLKEQQRWQRSVKDGDAVLKQIGAAILYAVPDLVHRGATGSSIGGEIVGETLAWNELDLDQRQQSIQAIVESFLKSEKGAASVDGTLVLPFNDVPVACIPNAIPDNLNLAAARERVGQVFREDASLLPANAVSGPLHIVGCYRGVSEAAARKLYGVEDATYIPLDAGMLVRDSKLKVQMLLVAKCADTSATRAALQELFEWIERSGQATVIAQHAKDRAVIVRAIQQVNATR